MTAKPELFAPIHKGLRSSFFKIVAEAGRLDYTDQESLNSFCNQVNAISTSLRHHADLEEKFIHPLLSERVPGGAEKLEEEHRNIHHQLDNLTTHLDRIRTKSANPEKRRELGQEFYLALNRFLLSFLAHFDKEEEQIQPALWNLCTFEELGNALNSIIASQKPEEAMQNLGMIIPATSLEELSNLLASAKANAPPEAFQGVLKLAESLLNPEDWSTLKSKIETT